MCVYVHEYLRVCMRGMYPRVCVYIYIYACSYVCYNGLCVHSLFRPTW